MGGVSASTASFTLLRGVVAMNALFQGVAGGLGFAFGAEQVFEGVPLDAAATLGLRLAGFTNLSTAVFGAYAAAKLETRPLVVFAVCAAAYHAMAAVEAARTAGLGGALGAVGEHASVFHAVCLVVLAAGVGRSALAR